MLVPNRHGSSDDYRYGFQGQEKDDELKGEGNSLNYTFRMHDPRIGRFSAIDPLTGKLPWNSPYAFSENRVIDSKELEGLERYHYTYDLVNGKKVLLKFATDHLDDEGNLFSFISYNVFDNDYLEAHLLHVGGKLYNFSSLKELKSFDPQKPKDKLDIAPILELSAKVEKYGELLKQVAGSGNPAADDLNAGIEISSTPMPGKGMGNPKVRSAANLGNKVHYDELNGGTGKELPSALVQQYPETNFRFAKRGEKGADVKYVSGKHPSEYPNSTWKPENNYADFKPNTKSGKSKFNSEVKNGKLPANTERIPYSSKTGKIE